MRLLCLFVYLTAWYAISAPFTLLLVCTLMRAAVYRQPAPTRFCALCVHPFTIYCIFPCCRQLLGMSRDDMLIKMITKTLTRLVVLFCLVVLSGWHGGFKGYCFIKLRLAACFVDGYLLAKRNQCYDYLSFAGVLSGRLAASRFLPSAKKNF